MKIILAINAGSSSVKISVFSAEQNHVQKQLADTEISNITAPPPLIKYVRGDVKVLNKVPITDAAIKNQDAAFKYLLKLLIEDKELPAISSKADISIACHRVVHGGEYASAQIINKQTHERLEQLTDLAPLHNSAALTIVNSCTAELPNAVNVAYFDSMFHQTIPEHIYTYPIDPQIAKANQLRKYGFHGISYEYITNATAEFMGKKKDDLNIIALHLGSGASACCVKGGKSYDTSMGLTPLAGLPGATRSGSVDPSLVFHYASDVGKLSPNSTKDLHITTAEEILNQQAGWKSMAGTTNFGAIAEDPKPESQLVFNMFVDRVCSFVGHYFVSLKGDVDAIVFAGGIGENSDKLRKAVIDQVNCLGFFIDDELNAKRLTHKVQEVGKAGAHRVLMCATDEQLQMAIGCAQKSELWIAN